jgi:hypothetical protein
VSTFHTFGDGVALHSALKTFFTSCKSASPVGTTWNVVTGGELIESTTGALTGVWGGGIGGTIVSTTGSEYAAGVGCRIVWETDGITGNKRVRGSTYWVPIAANQYEPNGTIATGTISTLETAGQALITALDGDLVILTKPKPPRLGNHHEVKGCRVPDRVSWLRSRRT